MVYVDSLREVTPSKNWRWRQACHMFADDLEELHEFAKMIGMKREWFQNHRLLPHYDLTCKRREKAIQLGAQEMSAKEFLWKKRK